MTAARWTHWQWIVMATVVGLIGQSVRTGAEADRPATPLAGFGCDGANAPAPAGARSIGAVQAERLESAVQASSRLALGRIAPQNRTNAPFALGQDLEKGSGKRPEELPVLVADCALRVGLPLVRNDTLAGRLRVGLCDRTGELTDAQICGAKAALAQAARLLNMSPASRMAGVPPLIERREGITVDYFPVVLRGRGLVLMYTAIATAPGSRYAVIVQVDGDKPCDDVPPATGCAGLASELTRLATTLGKRFLLAD
jgi:hypothetical protein